MNKALEKIAQAAAAIETNQERRAEYESGLASAQAAQAAAIEAQAAAETEKELDAALDAESRARAKIGFFNAKIDELKFSPRMDGAEYDSLVESAREVVSAQAVIYNKVARDCLQRLNAARANVIQTAEDADRVLTELDNRSNVLQSRHRYKRLEFQGMPDQLKEDPNEWLHHITRFGRASGEAFKMATADDDEKTTAALYRLWHCNDKN